MSVVIITSIIPGGPAEQDGELQVGDQVLSVDGQNILGYSYEKVGESKWMVHCFQILIFHPHSQHTHSHTHTHTHTHIHAGKAPSPTGSFKRFCVSDRSIPLLPV